MMTWNEKVRKIHEMISFIQTELTEPEELRKFLHELSHNRCLECCGDEPCYKCAVKE
jgi:hypothetical protein